MATTNTAADLSNQVQTLITRLEELNRRLATSVAPPPPPRPHYELLAITIDAASRIVDAATQLAKMASEDR